MLTLTSKKNLGNGDDEAEELLEIRYIDTCIDKCCCYNGNG